MRTKPSEHTEPDRDRALCYVLSVSLPDIHIRSHLISSHLPPPLQYLVMRSLLMQLRFPWRLTTLLMCSRTYWRQISISSSIWRKCDEIRMDTTFLRLRRGGPASFLLDRTFSPTMLCLFWHVCLCVFVCGEGWVEKVQGRQVSKQPQLFCRNKREQAAEANTTADNKHHTHTRLHLTSTYAINHSKTFTSQCTEMSRLSLFETQKRTIHPVKITCL